jgi:hypothetical protein
LCGLTILCKVRTYICLLDTCWFACWFLILGGNYEAITTPQCCALHGSCYKASQPIHYHWILPKVISCCTSRTPLFWGLHVPNLFMKSKLGFFRGLVVVLVDKILTGWINTPKSAWLVSKGILQHLLSSINSCNSVAAIGVCRGSLYRLLHRPNRELDEKRRIRMALDVVSEWVLGVDLGDGGGASAVLSGLGHLASLVLSLRLLNASYKDYNIHGHVGHWVTMIFTCREMIVFVGVLIGGFAGERNELFASLLASCCTQGSEVPKLACWQELDC